MKRLLLTLALSGAILIAGTPQQPSAATASASVARADPGVVADLRSALQPVLDAGAPGAIALVRRDHQVRRAAVGVANLGSGRLMGVNDHVRAGSVTKTFVAVVALQLVAERRLRLDDPVSRWLPGVLPYAGQITLRQLLNHTSGVPEYADKLFASMATQPGTPWLNHRTPSGLVAFVAHDPPLFPAGTAGSYSNTNYVLIGMIIERVTRRSLASEVERRVVDRLRLRGTSFPIDEPTLPRPAARGYADAGAGAAPVDVTEYHPSIFWAAGAMVSTAGDLGRFFRALLGGELLPARQLAQMLTFADAGGYGYGLGIFKVPTPCGPALGNNGAVPGFATDVFTSLDGRRQVVLSSNLYPGNALEAQESLVPTLFCAQRHR